MDAILWLSFDFKIWNHGKIEHKKKRVELENFWKKKQSRGVVKGRVGESISSFDI